jgi:hypothetical protein
MANEEKNKHDEVDIVDVEEFSRAGKEIPKGKKYRIRIDKEKYVVEKSALSGREILKLAGKMPETHILYLHSRGGQSKVIAADEVVDLTMPGVERFTTMKRENTEG